MESLIKMDDLGGVSLFFGNIHIVKRVAVSFLMGPPPKTNQNPGIHNRTARNSLWVEKMSCTQGEGLSNKNMLSFRAEEYLPSLTAFRQQTCGLRNLLLLLLLLLFNPKQKTFCSSVSRFHPLSSSPPPKQNDVTIVAVNQTLL